jgi:hypothetical protein
MIINMFNRRRVGPYLHDNVPLLQQTVGDDATSVSSTARGESIGEHLDTNRRETMIDLISQKISLESEDYRKDAENEQRAELQLNGTEEQMAVLQDLSELLYTRGCLQELGCTFTDLGELTTYGNPPTLKESELLLRLGSIYDEQ